MNAFKKFLAISSILTVALVAPEFVMGDTEIAGVIFNEEQMIIVLFLGIGAGTLVAYQGYRTTQDDWDTLKFFDGIIKNTIAAVPLAMGAAIMQTEVNLFVYATIFFAAMGISQQYSYTRKKTIPSNQPKTPT